MPPALPTVSIVIPAYNEEDTIKACVLAALDQTVPANEIIVVDNKSTDNTGAIVKALQFAFPDAPLIYFTQNDEQGLVPTRTSVSTVHRVTSSAASMPTRCSNRP